MFNYQRLWWLVWLVIYHRLPCEIRNFVIFYGIPVYPIRIMVYHISWYISDFVIFYVYHGISQTRPFNEDDQVMVALLSPRVHPWMRRLSLNRVEREEMVSNQKYVFFSYSLRMFMKRILLFFWFLYMHMYIYIVIYECMATSKKNRIFVKSDSNI